MVAKYCHILTGFKNVVMRFYKSIITGLPRTVVDTSTVGVAVTSGMGVVGVEHTTTEGQGALTH